jgi:hypothetical protein
MSFESTPGVTLRRIKKPSGKGATPTTESVFIFDLSKMTLATALANPTLSDQPMSEWTVEQLFRVMLAPRDPPKGVSPAQHEKDIAEARPAFLRHLTSAMEVIPFNRAALRFAAKHDPEGSVSATTITSFRSHYIDPDAPGSKKNTVLHISAEATLMELQHGAFGPPKRVLRDDLFLPRPPSLGFLSYLKTLRELRLNPLLDLIEKNNADVHKVLAAMASVQQINVALTVAEHASMHDRSKLWPDFFEEVGRLGPSYYLMDEAERKKLFWHGDDLCEENLNHKQIKALGEFRRTRIDPLVERMGTAAAWARAGRSVSTDAGPVKQCKSAKKRDEAAERLLLLLRMDDVIPRGLQEWDELSIAEQALFGSLLNDVFEALSRCPGATKSLMDSEFAAVARGAASIVTTIPSLPDKTARQRALATAVSRFDAKGSLPGKRTSLTDAIAGAFDTYEKTRKIPPPIVSLWAHSTPAILARFDKKTPGRVNIDGTAYLLRSVFGMGLLTELEMKELYADLDSIVESAIDPKGTPAKTKKQLDRLFGVELSHGKYPVRSVSWNDGAIFNSVKVAVGILGIRQSFASAVDEKTLPHERFVALSSAVLSTVTAADELHAISQEISIVGTAALRRPPSFLEKLPVPAKLALVTELVTVVSKYQAVSKTDEFSLKRDHANADLAVAWLSLMVVFYETVLGTTFPVAALALILLRWVLFDQKLWDLLGGTLGASPAMKMVRAIMEKIDDEKGEVGAFLREAPNWGEIKAAITNLQSHTPENIESAADYPLYFHLKTEHARLVRKFAVASYGLSEELAELVIEG